MKILILLIVMALVDYSYAGIFFVQWIKKKHKEDIFQAFGFFLFGLAFTLRVILFQI